MGCCSLQSCRNGKNCCDLHDNVIKLELAIDGGEEDYMQKVNGTTIEMIENEGSQRNEGEVYSISKKGELNTHTYSELDGPTLSRCFLFQGIHPWQYERS